MVKKFHHRLIIYVMIVIFSTSSFLLEFISFKEEQRVVNTKTTHHKSRINYLNQSELEYLCNETNDILKTVRNRSVLNATEIKFWRQSHSFITLNCRQLANSIPPEFFSNESTSLSNQTQFKFDLSLQRLAEKLTKLEKGSNLKIVVLGGSMTMGRVDFGRYQKQVLKRMAWPSKLQQFMSEKWNNIQVINLAVGGANEDVWLGYIDSIMRHTPIDIILVESAVNDGCDYDKIEIQKIKVHNKSDMLLNFLMNFPSDPAVLSIELFQTSSNKRSRGNRHCSGHLQQVKNPTKGTPCFYCPQWWPPQDWRKKAREKNSVSYISYRDAVWPVYSQPPSNLCYDYWYGNTHPQSLTHSLVASTILFHFMAVMSLKKELLYLLHQSKLVGKDKVALSPLASSECLKPISAYHAIEGSSRDEMDLPKTNFNSCWKFRADSREKFGWICEESKQTISSNNSSSLTKMQYLHLSKNISIGGKNIIFISRLVSYDHRMANAQVWFTAIDESSNQSFEPDHESNIFVDNPVWNISSWHSQRTSLPERVAINLNSFQFKNDSIFHSSSLRSKKSTMKTISSYEIKFNIRILPGTSTASQRNPFNGFFKFKLLGVITC